MELIQKVADLPARRSVSPKDLPPATMDSIDLAELAQRYGTPAYVYDLAAVRRAHHDLVTSLPAHTALHYSLKANPHPRLVAELARLGCQAEVASIGELDAAVDAGVAPDRVQLAGPGKTDTTIDHALGLGVTRFSVDSADDLDRIGARARVGGRCVRCLLRINADEPIAGAGLAMTGVASQFGVDASVVARHPARFGGRPEARVAGLHLYMGTNLADEDALLRQFEGSVRLARAVSAQLSGVGEVNLGGGFGVPYARAGQRVRFTGLAARLSALLDEHLPGWRRDEPRIAFESGRYLVGDAGTLVSRIVDVKVSKGRTFVILDTGVNHLGGMSGLRRLVPLVPTVDTLPITGTSIQDGGRSVVTCTVVGPLCTPLDTLARDVDLVDPRPGRFVAIPNVGAYGLTASLLAFLGHPAPIEVVVDGGRPVEVSRLVVRRTSSG